MNIFLFLHWLLKQPRTLKHTFLKIKAFIFYCVFRRPFLPFLEFHLVDHCNLNCKGCNHFSPLAAPHYSGLDQYKKDLHALHNIFQDIIIIQLMGGEPLLHPTPESFIYTTRMVFPRASINFFTNGILLPEASSAFWEACRITNSKITVSGYPIKSVDEKNLRSLAASNGVILSMKTEPEKKFSKQLNLSGNSDKQCSFNFCRGKYRSGYTCIHLKEGRIYHCPVSAHIHYFNSYFGCRIDADKGIDIHSQGISGSKILKQLDKPIENCRWCLNPPIQIPWSRSKGEKKIIDWGGNQ